MDLKKFATETRNPKTMNLDKMTPLQIVTAMNEADKEVPLAIEGVLPEIAEAVSMIEHAFMEGGRLFYMGAGTSGRLGVLDASECPPTFGVDAGMVVGLIAGGEKAFVKAVEGAEDSPELGRQDLIDHHLNEKDVVVGIAASGRTPYVLGGLKYAKAMHCKTIAISCNKGSVIGQAADLAIEAEPGPEVLTGSTRLKAGTMQKLILNMLSTASMVRIGLVYQNLMVNVVPSNEKLRKRAENIVMEATCVDRETAVELLEQAKGHVREAIKIKERKS